MSATIGPDADDERVRDEDHAAHVQRSGRVWDFWSRWYEFNDRDTEPYRRAAVDALDLSGGETVVDVGCGPGSNFAMLRDRVGPEGRVIGVDIAPKMVQRARDRIDAAGWENVEVILADATRFPFDDVGRVDAAVATLAMSTMPDVRSVTGSIAETVRPGGRFAVYDTRLVPAGPARVLNPLIDLVYRYGANWNAEEDVLATMEAVFGTVDVVDTYLAGAQYVAVAETR